MLNAEVSRLVLPPVPTTMRDRGVAVWSEPVVIDSYLPEEAEAFPEYLDSRVYQGSSGKVFPLPFIERVSATKVPQAWEAIHLENAWLRIVVLPELGGRIHIGYDKVADYDFFYRNNVIKPALVGLTGPWLSGGVEFNWPQHHRPATFLPTDVEIEEHPDGSVTVWCSDHDPFARMQGMHGIHLAPNSSRVEARVRLYNRSELTQTFLWWANVAAQVGDNYQSFFPQDVGFVADHAQRAITGFPEADRPYYGIDYPARRDPEHPDADRLDWYRNIPVPTSYMITDTCEEFFGGYDHARDAGFVHWAPREVSPGKKQWTWGNSAFGRAWDDNLTDSDGPYVELMAGVFTDNQPDFAWLAPGEMKSFRQVWYPVRGTGLPTAASEHAAARLVPANEGIKVTIAPAEVVLSAHLMVWGEGDRLLHHATVDLDPAATLEVNVASSQARLELWDGDRLILAASSVPPPAHHEPSTAQEPPEPSMVQSIDELHAIATYLQQYRHASRSPEPYWVEAIRRDAGDVRARTAMGAIDYGRARYDDAAHHLSIAVDRSTRWAPTPRDAEPLYLLGLVEARRGDDSRAEGLFARAAWDSSWRDPALFALARLRASRGHSSTALAALEELLSLRPDHLQSRDLLALLLRARGRGDEADSILADVLTRDPLDQWARHLTGRPLSGDPTIVLDVALEYAAAGSLLTALEVLDLADAAIPAPGQVHVGPIVSAHRAILLDRLGRSEEATAERVRGARLDARHAQALRLEDIAALEAWLVADPIAVLPALLLGNWYYDRRRPHDAKREWMIASTAIDPDIAVIAHRNLGLMAHNLDRDPTAARHHYETAVRLAPGNAKLLYEFDQLRGRLGESAAARLASLEERREIVDLRDDLSIVFVELLIAAERIDEARTLVTGRTFQPWEGGEGRVLAVWDAICLAQARSAIEQGNGAEAERLIDLCLSPPRNLGEGRHELANAAELWLVLGDARKLRGDRSGAAKAWRRAASDGGDFVGMSPTLFSRRTLWSIEALRRLGEVATAKDLQERLRSWLDQWAVQEPKIDFFATSLPSMLLFTPDFIAERDVEVKEIRRQLATLT